MRYWRDSAGPEVDYVLDYAHQYIPVEVKWTDKPTKADARHIKKLIKEYPIKQSYIVCRTPQRYKIDENITALPWQEINLIFKEIDAAKA